MNSLVIILIAVVVLGAGYLGYGRWLAKKWGIDANAKTPAVANEDGKDYVSFYSKEDMLNKIAYYLEHEDERKQIAHNGQEKVCKEHTYDIHLKEMLDLVFDHADPF